MRRLLDLRSSGTWNGEPVQPFQWPQADYDRQLRECLSLHNPTRSETLKSIFTFSRLGEFGSRPGAAGACVPEAMWYRRHVSREGSIPAGRGDPLLPRRWPSRRFKVLTSTTVATLQGTFENSDADITSRA